MSTPHEIQVLYDLILVKDAEIRDLRSELTLLSNTVDEALLLDENLSAAWDDLHNAVQKSRSALGGYDRMNPEFKELKKRLLDYSKIDHGTEAYPLSKAEATLLVTMLISLQIMVRHYKVFEKLKD